MCVCMLEGQRKREKELVSVCESVCVCVCVLVGQRKRERELVSVCVSQCVCGCVSMCLCVSGIEKERERES